MSESLTLPGDYGYSDANHRHSHSYILPCVEEIISSHSWSPGARALDFGCGNGAVANWLLQKDFSVVGIDPSESGIAEARKAYQQIEFLRLGSNDSLSRLGSFDLVTCTEVIEHCYDPCSLLSQIHRLLKPNGIAIVSTPYHGYLKNLLLALTGNLDRHFTALRVGGHIKFFSIKTLSEIISDTDFVILDIKRVGRVPPLAKSMIFCMEKKY